MTHGRFPKSFPHKPETRLEASVQLLLVLAGIATLIVHAVRLGWL